MAAKTGVLAGYPLINVKVTLVDGTYHQVDSSQIAFELAGRLAFQEAVAQGRADAARADHEGRRHDAGGVRRQRDRRH